MSQEEKSIMADIKKCAHPPCQCTIGKNSQYGDYCSQACQNAKDTSEIRCNCQHPECR
jgi:hypothetical protein